MRMYVTQVLTIFVLKELCFGANAVSETNESKPRTELRNEMRCFGEHSGGLIPIVPKMIIICLNHHNITKNNQVERKGIQKRFLHRILKKAKISRPLPINHIHKLLFYYNTFPSLYKKKLNSLNLNNNNIISVSQTAKEADSNILESTMSSQNSQIELTLPKKGAEYNNYFSDIVDNNTRNNGTRHIIYETINGKKIITRSFGAFDTKLYKVTREKLLSISPSDRKGNGISFVQSGLFLYLALLALSTELDPGTKADIDKCLNQTQPDESRIRLINDVITNLPASSGELMFRWSLRLAISRNENLSQRFRATVAPVLRLQLHEFNGSEAPVNLAKILNEMVKNDSGLALDDTFEVNDFSKGIRGVLLTTLYFRGRWRSAPTLLNGTTTFFDADGTPKRSSRMIRINDIMLYADLQEWDAQVIEINYATPDLSFLIIVPKSRLLGPLIQHMSNSTLENIIAKMRPKRIEVTMPLYTLRMTLLLPNKLMDMGMTSLIDGSNKDSQLRLSHGVQRIMFWAEAGRNAFKDDGLEWDDTPEKKLIVNRPYLFYVRWRNLTLMNGNFAL